jgi:hypothetical protein
MNSTPAASSTRRMIVGKIPEKDQHAYGFLIPLIIAFVILAAFTHSSGLRAPATAAPAAGARGSYDSDNGHEGGRLGRLLRDEAFLIAVNIA